MTVDRVNAALVRGHCRLMAAGMTHSSLTKTYVLRLAERITSKTYKRGQHAQAAEDITEVLNETSFQI